MTDNVTIRDGEVDLATRTVHRGEANSRLTTNDAALLRYLVRRSDRAVPRDELLTAVWGYDTSITTRVVDLAVYRLRKKIELDPSNPTQVITVRHVGYRFVPIAPSQTPVTARATVPFLGALLGRQADLAALDAASKAVALVGPPGIGKTHLASFWASTFDGAWWVDLSSAEDSNQAINTIADVCRVPIAAAQDPLETVGFALAAAGRAILVLDGVDPLVGPLEQLVKDLCTLAPELTTLTTSRRAPGPPLQCHRLGPLDPTASAQLFQSAAPLPVDPDQVGPLLDLLQHTPLTIRLAARWSAIHPLPELHQTLRERLELLGSGVPTLDRVVGWTWDELEDEDRRALVRLSAFRSPFPLASAAVVLDQDVEAVAERLIGLIDRSLVEASDTPRRFRVVAAVAAFAATADPQERERALERLPMAFRREGAVLLQAHEGTMATQRAWALKDRLADLMVSVTSARRLERPELGGLLLMAAALQRHLLPVHARRALLDEAVSVCVDPFLQARARLWRAYLLRTIAPDEAAADLAWLVDQAPRALAMEVHRMHALVALSQGRLEDAEAAGRAALAQRPPPGRSAKARSQALITLALVVRQLHGPQQALPHATACLAEAESDGDPYHRCNAHQLLGHLQAHLGQYPTAQAHFETALSLARAHGFLGPAASTQFNLGNLASRHENHPEAIHWYASSETSYRRLGPRPEVGQAAVQRASSLLSLGRLDEAAEVARQVASLPWIDRSAHVRGRTWFLKGQIAYAQGDPATAADLFGVALAVWVPRGPMTAANLRLAASCALADAGQTSQAEEHLAAAHSALQGMPDPSLQALALAADAHLSCARGRTDTAQVAFAALDALIEGRQLPDFTEQEVRHLTPSGSVGWTSNAIGPAYLRERRKWLEQALHRARSEV